MGFWTGLIFGLMLGTSFGFIACSFFTLGKRADEETERRYRGKQW